MYYNEDEDILANILDCGVNEREVYIPDEDLEVIEYGICEDELYIPDEDLEGCL